MSEPVAWASSLDFDDDEQEIIPAKDKGKLGTSNCDIPLYTSEANARLIAAAPDLLEALQQATSALEWRWERVANRAAPVHETAIQEAYNQARAAIAKATGEKS